MIDYPQESSLAALQHLWQEAFGDDAAFIEMFFDHIFSPDRCRCMTVDGDVVAALYWLDCRLDRHPLAYIYAVATKQSHRGKGFCRALMDDTHRLLRELGYAGCVLVPGEEKLFQMYASMGYETCSNIREFDCKAGSQRTSLRSITAEEYAAERRLRLPEHSVLQEGENLAFLSLLAQFYAGDDFLLCASIDGKRLNALELLGPSDAAPAILATLGVPGGCFRTPGQGRDFAMYYPLSDSPAPQYFAFAFD